MKAILFIWLIFFSVSSCNTTKQSLVSENTTPIENETVPLIEYNSNSRSFFRKITIDNGRIFVQVEREAKPVFWTLQKEDIKAILVAYNEIQINKLSKLKAPTEARFYDGAPITNLVITKDSRVYRTPDFDGGFPPKHVEKLVNVLLKVADNLNK